jgi:hypothetical protein
MKRLRAIASTTVLFLAFGSVAGMIVLGVFAIPFTIWRYPDGELAQKEQWSLLQSLEMKHREDANASGVRILPRALKSSYTAIGLPRADQPQGYVWVIANPTGQPKVKVLGAQAPFRLSIYEFDSIRNRTIVDADVAKFLVENVK